MDTLRALAEQHLLPPRFLKLAITGRCNLRCRHCWPDSGPESGGPVPAECILELLGEFSDLGGTGVSITGGEPLTHPRWREVLGSACRMARVKQVELQTNATLLGSQALSFLKELGPGKLTIRISVDGARAESNDPIRGTGTFAAVLQALEALSGTVLSSRVILSMTETEDNYGEIPDLLELAERFGVPRVETATLLLRGRAARDDAPRGPLPEQVAALVERYNREAGFRRLYDAIGCTSALEWARWHSQPREHYCNFVENPFVDVHGRFFPCAMYEREEAAVEGAFDRPLADILRSGTAVWGQLRRASRERIDDPGACSGCSGWCHCRGGCFGRSGEVGGDSGGREDRCALRRAVYGPGS